MAERAPALSGNLHVDDEDLGRLALDDRVVQFMKKQSLQVVYNASASRIWYANIHDSAKW